MDKDGSTSRTPSNLYSVKRNLSVPIALGLPSALAGRRRASLSTCNIVETTKISRDFDKDTGNKTINQYMIVRELGRGAEGKVKLVVDTVTNELWAIKIVSKTQKRSQISKLSAAYRLGQDGHLAKVRKEIAILKKCRHDHIVALKEVIDDPLVDKIYMVLEYLEGGEVKWQNPKGPPGPSIPLSQCASIFRDLVCGLQYCNS